MTKRLAKGQVPFSQLVHIETAHDVRKLEACVHCEHIGHRNFMLYGNPYENAYFHGRCFVAKHGKEALLDLASTGHANHLTLGDLGVELSRAVVDRNGRGT